MYNIATQTRNTYLAITPAKLGFLATQVKPLRAVLGTGWIIHRENCREGPYFVLSFLLLLFCLLCGGIFKSALKSIFSSISAPGFRKKTQTRQYSSVKIIISSLQTVAQN